MSLILEALRKSETERRRAQAPDLFAEPAVVARHDSAASPRWLTWILAALTALVLAGWLTRGLWNAPLPSVAAEPASTRANVMPPRASQPIPDQTPPTPRQAQEPTIESPVRVASAPAPVHQPAVASLAPAVPAQTLQSRSVPTPTVAEVPQIAVGALPENNSTRAPAPESTSAPAHANASTLDSTAPLRLADLGNDERRQLPTLKMSMHLWDAESAKRFVILDGERMGEGARIGDAVIDEITRDGVLLAWQGRLLKLPIQ